MNLQEIMEIGSVYLPPPNTHPLTENVIFNYIVNKEKFFALISRIKEEINCLFEMLQPEIAIGRRLGAQPRSSHLDALVCYLIWLKLRLDYKVIITILPNISKSRIEDNVKRIRPFLHYALYLKWLAKPCRPFLLSHSSFPHAEIIINCHTT
jgi:hypothetical protein